MRNDARFCMACGAYIQPAPGSPVQVPAFVGSYANGLPLGVELEPGGLVVRFIALIIDSSILLAVNLAVILSYVMLASSGSGGVRDFLTPTTVIAMWLFDALFFAGFESSNMRATPGKWVVGLSVTDMDGQQLGLLHAVGRYFFKVVTNGLFVINLLCVVFSGQNRTLYDLLVGTIVIERPVGR
jgi:uncharacterized RDD family membrane protein YckC